MQTYAISPDLQVLLDQSTPKDNSSDQTDPSCGFQFHSTKFDGLSLAVTPVEMMLEDKPFCHGTAFIWRRNSRWFLITNWHNLSGQNPFDGASLNKNGFVPAEVKAYPAIRKLTGDWNTVTRGEVQWPLYQHFDQPLWMQHQHFADLRVDIAVLEFPSNDIPYVAINDYGFDKIFTTVGADLFVIGYPFSQFDEMKLPLWKRGSLASEPLAGWNRRPAFLIDAASRPGMSGSPVIRRVFGPAPKMVNGELIMQANQAVTSELVGVYAGHLNNNKHAEVTIGFAWYATLIDEIISTPHPGSRL